MSINRIRNQIKRVNELLAFSIILRYICRFRMFKMLYNFGEKKRLAKVNVLSNQRELIIYVATPTITIFGDNGRIN